MPTDNIKIDKDIQALCPILTEEEKEQLYKNLEKDGCRDALVVWKETNILLDGHNRREWCLKNKREYKIQKIAFRSKEFAVNWVIDNQLGRRNLSPEQASYLRGKRYLIERRVVGRPQKKPGSEELGRTDERLAEEYGVSATTIRSDVAFAEAVDELADKGGEEAKRVALDGTLSKTQTQSLSGESTEIVQEVTERITEGEKPAEVIEEVTVTPKKFGMEKPGNKVIFNDGVGWDLIGNLARFFDARSNKYGKGERHDKCLDTMREVEKAFRQWQENT